MKVIFTCLLLVVPILAYEDQDPYDDDDDIYVYYDDAPILGPSRVSLAEIYDPNFQVNPESTLTYNYEQTRNGEEPRKVELRSESVQHFFRVRKPTSPRTLFHIKRNKLDQKYPLDKFSENEKLHELKDVELEMGPNDNGKVSNENQHVTPIVRKTLVESTIPIPETKRRMLIKRPTTQIKNKFDEPSTTPLYEKLEDMKDMKINVFHPVTIIDTDDSISADPVKLSTSVNPNYNTEDSVQLPRMRIRNRQKLRKEKTVENIPEADIKYISTSPTTETLPLITNYVSTSVPSSSPRKIEDRIRDENLMWSSSPQTTEYTTTLATTTKEERDKNDFMIKSNSQNGNTQSNGELKNEESNNHNYNARKRFHPSAVKDQTETVSDSSLPEVQVKSKARRMRHRIPQRRFKKVKHVLNGSMENLSSTSPRNSHQYATPKEENETVPNEFVEEQSSPRSTEIPKLETSEKPNLKHSRSYGRKWSHPSTTTSTVKPESSSVTPTNLDLSTASDTVTAHPRRMRYRNRFRKDHRVNKAQSVEAENMPSAQIISSTTVPQTTTTTTLAPAISDNYYSEDDSQNTNISTENTSIEKPKGRFNKDNPPPPLPTLSPWYDGYGK